MVVPFVILLSTTGMNNDVVKLKKKKFIKHVVTISVAISILFALIVVTGVILAFELPPRNQKFPLKKTDTADEKENWKHQVHAVFAVNLVGPKDMRLRRSAENIKRYTLQVIRSLLFNYYGSDAQFVIQTYSVPGKTTISDFCNAICTMRYIDQIDQDQETFIAVWQYYRFSLGRKPSLYILFVADRASYRDDAVFEKDMLESNKILEETKLANKTETVFINDANTSHYFMYNNIISDEGNVSETANLINDKLISYYRNYNELNTDAIITTVTDSSQFVIPYTIKETASMPIIDDEKNGDNIDIQMIPLNEFAPSTIKFHRNTDIFGTNEQETIISSASSIEKSSENEPSSIDNIPKSIFDMTDSSEDDFIIEKTNIFSIEQDNDNAALNDNHSVSTQSTTITSPFLWMGNSDSFDIDDMNVEKVKESMNHSMQFNPSPSSTDQTKDFVNSTADEITSIRSDSINEHSTQRYHPLTEKSSYLHEYISSTDSPTTIIEMSPKFQMNDEVEEAKNSEISDNLFSDSSIQTSSIALEMEAIIDSKAISETSPRIDNSGNHDTILHAKSHISSLPLSEESNDVIYDDAYTSTTDDANFSTETINLHSINLDSITSSTTIVPLVLLKASTMDEMIVAEALTSMETNESTGSTTESLTRKTATYLETSTIPPSDTNVFTSINLDGFFENDYYTNMSNIPHITETESSIKQMDNEASILEAFHTISNDISNDKSATMTSDSEISNIFIQEDIYPSISSDKNMEYFTPGKSNSFLTTEFSTTLKILPEDVINLSGILTGTASEQLITDNFQESTSNDLSSYAETSRVMKLTDLSEIENNLFVASKLSTFATTESSDDGTFGNFLTRRNDGAIIDNESLDMPSTALITTTISDKIVTANGSAFESQIFPDKKIFDISLETSTISSLGTENFIETSIVTEDAIKGMQTRTTITDHETKLTSRTETIQPMAIFNITLSALQYNAKSLSQNNRTSNNYIYLLLDEVSYKEEMESESFDPSKITSFIIDNEPISFDDLGSDTNETNNDFYLDDSLSSVDDTMVEEKFRLANLALENKHEMQSESEAITTISTVLDGSIQGDAVTDWMKNADRHHNVFSIDSNSASYHFTKNTIPISPLENVQFSVISHDFEELTRESDGNALDHQESINTTVSQIENLIKFDSTTRTLYENFNDPIAIHSKALNDAENPSNTLPFNDISSTSSPEIEEIAARNTNHRKIVHQTQTILQAEKPTINDSSLSVISTIQSTSTLKPIIAFSSDQIFRRELSTKSGNSYSQSEIDKNTTEVSKNEKWQSVTEENNNTIDTFQTSFTDIISSITAANSFIQQKVNMDKNNITSVNTVILNDKQNDTSFTDNSISSSVTSTLNNLTENSHANRETFQPFSGIFKNTDFSSNRSDTIDNFTN
ncbi:unnamed protein product [Acanthocheilonema viteae]|uniref:Uncharacterized protein n=1 Tax=Acanthocheilonema viteae TaxID=6277 RepID=A0A498SQH3_ACAVI|nr:unnamed protein product [Acanthocheilonema viteae]